MIENIIEIYDKYQDLGIKTRKITEGREIKLVRDYIGFRKDSFCATEQRKLAIFLESKVDYAYPDIVFVEFNPQNYYNWNEYRDKLEKNDLKILYHIYAMKGLQIGDLVSQLGVTWKEAAISIEKLYDSNLVTRQVKRWSIVDEDKIAVHKIQAVEAKINNWEDVLQQTIINRNFASESYALSVIESKPKKEVLDKFKKFGIGICLQNKNDFEVLKEAKLKKIPVSFNSIFFNEWVGRILNSRGGVTNAIG